MTEVFDDPRAAVRVDGLTKSFDDARVLDGVSFAVPRGTVLGVLGPNGAGKTTLVNVLCTLHAPDAGTAAVAGCDVAADPAGVRAAISMTGQYASLDETLTGRDNLVFFGRMLGLRRRAAHRRADELLDLFDLAYAAALPVYAYSGGMRRRLDIACGLVVAPEVVFLDEPTTGLDPRSRQDVWDLVDTLRSTGITTILTTQYLEEADRLADDIIVLDRGRIVAQGTAEQLKREIGGTFCEAVPVDPGDVERLHDVLAAALSTDHRVGFDDETVTLAALDGVQTMARVIAAADGAGITLRDVGLRSPSLDDVFLTLTERRVS